MNKVNARLVEDIKLIHTNNLKDIPEFHFAPLDLAGNKSMLETCEKLWKSGVVSTKTYLEMNGYNLAKEKDQRETEGSDGTDEVFTSRETKSASQPSSSESSGTSTDLQSDPDASRRGKQPKPSSP